MVSCAAGGTPFSVTGAAGASDIGGGRTGGNELRDELVEPVSSCQTWGLRKKSKTLARADFECWETPPNYVAMTFVSSQSQRVLCMFDLFAIMCARGSTLHDVMIHSSLCEKCEDHPILL